MKKTKIIIAIGLFIVTSIVVISVQSENKNEKIGSNYKNISYIGLNEFVNMDLGLIGFFPTEQNWKQISKNIESVPLDSLRYIDSLDIHNLADTLYVKIYTQNYAYQSSNTYKISKNTNRSSDTLKIFNFIVDLKMKDIIADAENFRIQDFTVDYIIKQNVDKINKRIIIKKNFR